VIPAALSSRHSGSPEQQPCRIVLHWNAMCRNWVAADSYGHRVRRLFLRKLKTELKIPVLALVDSDPYGLKILSVYMKGGGICWNAASHSFYMSFSVQLL
jgi:hypothetical protein